MIRNGNFSETTSFHSEAAMEVRARAERMKAESDRKAEIARRAANALGVIGIAAAAVIFTRLSIGETVPLWPVLTAACATFAAALCACSRRASLAFSADMGRIIDRN